MGWLRRKKQKEIREKILERVYEENLLILGKVRPALSPRRPIPIKRILLLGAIFTSIFLIHGQSVDTAFPPTKQNMSIQPDPLPPASPSSVGPANSSEFVSLDFFNNSNVPLSRMLGLKIKTIVIDPGHGGSDPGTIGKMGTMEKDVTLDIARRLKAHLLRSGRCHVRMTREEDLSLTLPKRVNLAVEAKADLFLSIHVNSLPNKPVNIVETYYFGPSSDERTLRLAEQENAGSEYGLSDLKEIVERLSQTMKLQESKEFAESIQKHLYSSIRKQSKEIKNYGVKRAPFVVLLGLDVPSVLVEVSCLSYPEEERELLTEDHREHIAASLATGIFDYLNKGALTYEAKR